MYTKYTQCFYITAFTNTIIYWYTYVYMCTKNQSLNISFRIKNVNTLKEPKYFKKSYLKKNLGIRNTL